MSVRIHFLPVSQDLFHIFCVENGNWRMRLHSHRDWKDGDQREQVFAYVGERGKREEVYLLLSQTHLGNYLSAIRYC